VPLLEIRPEAEKVRLALLERGLETPMISSEQNGSAKKAALEKRFREIMEILGLDLTDDSLKDTPLRDRKNKLRFPYHPY
jgi:GTP cyclohydrolase I